MSDWCPQIVRIEKIEKHPWADTLSIATVMGDYPVVIRTGQYEVGQLAGYINIDTVVPDTEQFYFLCPKAYEQYEEYGEVKSKQVGMKFPLGSIPLKYRVLKAKKNSQCLFARDACRCSSWFQRRRFFGGSSWAN